MLFLAFYDGALILKYQSPTVMLLYWLLSCLLSLLGWGIYVLVLRERLAVLHAKWVLVAIVILSWTMPFMVPSLPEQTQALQEHYLPDYRDYDHWNMVNLQDEALLSCYKTANTSKDQCHCEIKQQAVVLDHQSNPYYNCILACKEPFVLLLYGVMALWWIQLLFRIACLWGLVASSRIERRELAGQIVWLLRPPAHWQVAVSSFTLWRSYIVLPETLEARFSARELEAILFHELGHLKQRDTWQQMGLQLLQSVWWMHPLFYAFRKELHQLNEYVADDFAVQYVGNAKWYAKLLVKAKEYQLQQAPTAPIQLVLYAVQSLLRQRVVRLVQKPHRGAPPHWAGALLVVGLLFWQTSAVTLPILQAQDQALQQYENWRVQEQSPELCPSCLKQH